MAETGKERVSTGAAKPAQDGVEMKRQRQAAIMDLVRSGGVRSQGQLVDMLRETGFEVSQTTVSRDIKELGLSKGTDGEGLACYGNAEALTGRSSAEGLLRSMAAQFLLGAEPTGNLVVLRTSPGNAQGLAAALDAAELKGVVGTVAGDDTILVVCSEGADSKAISRRIEGYAYG